MTATVIASANADELRTRVRGLGQVSSTLMYYDAIMTRSTEYPVVHQKQGICATGFPGILPGREQRKLTVYATGPRSATWSPDADRCSDRRAASGFRFPSRLTSVSPLGCA